MSRLLLQQKQLAVPTLPRLNLPKINESRSEVQLSSARLDLAKSLSVQTRLTNRQTGKQSPSSRRILNESANYRSSVITTRRANDEMIKENSRQNRELERSMRKGYKQVLEMLAADRRRRETLEMSVFEVKRKIQQQEKDIERSGRMTLEAQKEASKKGLKNYSDLLAFSVQKNILRTRFEAKKAEL